MEFNSKLVLICGLLLMVPVTVADITHSGTVSVVRNYAASADSAYNESWSWAQISGLTGVVGCPSGDVGAGEKGTA